MLFDLPSEVLFDILCRCTLKEILSFEETCKASHTLVASRYLWLTLIRDLDQARAPNLPPHISVEDLPYSSLRCIVVQAVQAYRNIKSGHLSSRTRDVLVELYDIPADDGLIAAGGPDLSHNSNKDNITLILGGEYLLVQWSHGYIQLVDIKAQKSVWTYPPPLLCDERPDDYMLVSSYVVDTREDGLVTVVLRLCRPREALLSMLEVFRIDTITAVSCPKVERVAAVDFRSVQDKHLYVSSASVQGDYIALKCHGFPPSSMFLVLINYITEQIVYTNESHLWSRFRPDVTIIREHLFHVCPPSLSAGSLVLIRAVYLRRLFAQLKGHQYESGSSQTMTITAEALGFTNFSFNSPKGYVVTSASLPSLCTYHWKEPQERLDQITMMDTIAASIDSSPLVILNRYAFSPQTETDAPNLKFISSSGPTKPASLGGPKCMHCRGESLTLSGTGLLYYGDSWNAWGCINGRAILSISTEQSGQEEKPSLHFSADDIVQWVYPATTQVAAELDYEWDGTGMDHLQCTLDYWSDALLVRRTGERWITIKYPA